MLAVAGRVYLILREVGRLAALVGEAGKAFELRDIEDRLRKLEEQDTRKRW